MLNIDILPVAPAIQSDVRLLADKLRAYGGIQVDILSLEGNTLKVRVVQHELKNNFLLNQKQLIARAAQVMEPVQGAFKIQYFPLTYKPELSHVDKDWINGQMESFKLSRNDLNKQMGIDKSTLSELLTGNRNLTNFQKAAFFYYFMTYQLNRDIREFMESND